MAMEQEINPHDKMFSRIYETEKESISAFLDAVFGYFYRTCPKKMFDNSNGYGKQLLLSSYTKWQTRFVGSSEENENSSNVSSPSVEKSPERSFQLEELVSSYNVPKPGGPTYTTNTATTSRGIKHEHDMMTTTGSKIAKKNEKVDMDTTNGAQCDKYSWSQTIEDLEIRIPIPSFIKKGNQVNVDIKKTQLKVEAEISENSTVKSTIIENEFLHPINVQDSVWFLSPGQHLSILIEKEKEKWWDRFLVSEQPIDMSTINPERHYSSLPEDERMQIDQIISDTEKKESGKLNHLIRKNLTQL